MTDYTRRIKATREETNSIEYAKLLLAAHIGKLCPAKTRQETGAEGGRGKKRSAPAAQTFDPHTLTDYRKLAKHQAEGVIDGFRGEAVGAKRVAMPRPPFFARSRPAEAKKLLYPLKELCGTGGKASSPTEPALAKATIGAYREAVAQNRRENPTP